MVERHLISNVHAMGWRAFLGFLSPDIAQKVFVRRPDRTPVHRLIARHRLASKDGR
jgi:hypothetical protein